MSNELDLTGSFTDKRVFMVPHEQPSQGVPLDYIGSSQSCDGPTYIHIGVALTDEQLQAVWESRRRFPMITLNQLRMVRDRKVSILQVV